MKRKYVPSSSYTWNIFCNIHIFLIKWISPNSCSEESSTIFQYTLIIYSTNFVYICTTKLSCLRHVKIYSDLIYELDQKFNYWKVSNFFRNHFSYDWFQKKNLHSEEVDFIFQISEYIFWEVTQSWGKCYEILKLASYH